MHGTLTVAMKAGAIFLVMAGLIQATCFAATRLETYSVGATANGVLQIYMESPQGIQSASAFDINRSEYPFRRGRTLWTATVPLSDYLAGTHEFPIRIQTLDGVHNGGVTVNVVEGTPTWNVAQAKINDLVFDINLLTARLVTANPAPKIDAQPLPDIEPILDIQTRLISALMAQWERHLIVNRNEVTEGAMLDQLVTELGQLNAKLDETRQTLIKHATLVTLLTKFKTSPRHRLSKKDTLALQTAYYEFFSKRFSANQIDQETMITDVKVQSLDTYHKKLDYLAQRDDLMSRISRLIGIHPHLKPARNPTMPATQVGMAARGEWTSPDAVIARLKTQLTALTESSHHQLPASITAHQLQILDLKNGRADFTPYWDPNIPEYDGTDTITALEATLTLHLLQLKQKQAEYFLAKTIEKQHEADIVLQKQTEKTDSLHHLLTELNEAVKKKIYDATTAPTD